MDNWYNIENHQEIVSPALLVYPDRIKYNIELMIAMAKDVQSLRPHIKTHKIAEIIQLQQDYGIHKFKCSTITEAELLAKCNAKDILLAMQTVEINSTRFFELIAKYPNSKFSTIVDNAHSISEVSKLAFAKNKIISLWLDINNGMDRTGVLPNEEAMILYKKMVSDPNIHAEGLHVYDGHIHESDIRLRTKICNKDFEPVLRLKSNLEKTGIQIKTIIAGGTPTFPIHTMRKGIETSPGTPLLWDEGYAKNYQDLKFLPTAVLLTRVISKPKSNFVCYDLGHKSVASEMKIPRVQFLNDSGTQISQSEEHLVVKNEKSYNYSIGDISYAIPIHICPTVIKYDKVLTVTNHKVTGFWKVAAREH